MAWNAGTYSRVSTTVSPASANTTIASAEMNTYTADVTAGINACMAKDGSNAATGDIDAGSNQIENLADGALHTDAANLGQIQDAAHAYAVDQSIAADTIEVGFTPVVTALAAGQTFRVLMANTNEGATDIEVDGIAAADVLDSAGNELVGNELIAGGIYTFVYDGTQFLLQDATLGQVRNAAYAYDVDTGILNNIAIAPEPAITVYATGQVFRVKMKFTNTAAVSMGVNGIGGKNVWDQDGEAMVGGELIIDGIYTFVYDGTQFILQGTTKGQIQNALFAYGVDDGILNNMAIDVLPEVTTYAAGMTFRVKVLYTNTGPLSLGVDDAGGKNVYDQQGNALRGGEVTADSVYTFVYDGTQFILQTTTIGQVQNAGHAYAVDSGSDGSIEVAFTPPVTAYAAGQAFRVLVVATNTGAVNLDAGPGAKNVFDVEGNELRGGELILGGVYTFVYDGTQFQLQSTPMERGTFTPQAEFGGASVGLVQTESGTYTRIFDTVFCRGSIIITNLGSSSGQLGISGMPYGGVAATTQPVTVGFSNVGHSGYPQAWMGENEMLFYEQPTGGTGTTTITEADCTTDTVIHFQATYFV